MHIFLCIFNRLLEDGMIIDGRNVHVIVMHDLDGTVLGEKGEDPFVEDTPVAEVLTESNNLGIVSGWLSDTSLQGLQLWEEMLGIASGTMQVYAPENGLYTECVGDRIRLSARQWHLAADFRYMELQRYVLDSAAARGMQTVQTHPATWVKRTVNMQVAPPTVIAVDATRVGSFAAEVRRINPDGSMRIDKDLTAEFAAEVVIPKAVELFGTTGHHEPLVGPGWIMVPSLAPKGDQIRWLRSVVPESVRIFMIGNSNNDATCAGIDGVTLVAVADSRGRLKDVANRVTNAPCSRGVIELHHAIRSGHI